MARMHARKRGKSSSNKPANPSIPKWVNYKKAVVEQLMIKLSKSGVSNSEIGQTLRDEYGIPDSRLITGGKITQILKEKNIKQDYPDDLFSLFKKAVKLRNHIGKNHKDHHNHRGLQLTESKIRRLLKYYKNKGTLSKDFRYDPERIKLIVG